MGATGRVCIFLSFEAFKTRADFESNLEASGTSFSDVFGQKKKTVLTEKTILWAFLCLGSEFESFFDAS